MPIQGDLSTMPVPELMMWISQCQKTGTLEIRANEWKETMAFENGALIFSASWNPERTLGRLLMKHGIVPEDVHTRARERRETESVAVATALGELQILTDLHRVRFLSRKQK